MSMKTQGQSPNAGKTRATPGPRRLAEHRKDSPQILAASSLRPGKGAHLSPTGTDVGIVVVLYLDADIFPALASG
jgi:hypothetical protein